MQAIEKNNFLANKLFFRYLIPSLFSLFANAANSLIDTAIVGNYLGDNGLAAMGIVAPVHLIFLTIGSTICVGSAISFSYSLGKRDIEKARSYFGFAILAVLIFGILLSAICLPLYKQIASLLGAKGEVLEMASSYLFYYFCGGVFTMLLYVPLNFSKVQGNPKIAMLLLVVMATVNVGLTYLFVAVLKMGTGGASLATVVAVSLAFFLGCFFIFQKNGKLNPSFKKLNFKEIFGAVFSGSAAGFNNFVRFVTILGINSIIVLILSQSLLSTYSIARSVQDLLLCIVLGVSQSIMPIIAMFCSEKDNAAAIYTFKKAITVGLALVVSSIVIVTLLRTQIVSFFGGTNSKENSIAVILMCLALVPSLINNVFTCCYSSTKKLFFAPLVMGMRVLFTLAFAVLFATLKATNLLFLAFFLGEMGTLICFLIIILIYSKKNKNLVPIYLFKKASININSFSIKCTQEDIIFASQNIVEFIEEKDLPMKIQMKISLCIEELLMNILVKGQLKENEFIDLNIIFTQDDSILRFRYGGKQNNPFDALNDLDVDDADFGITLIKKTVLDTQYFWMFGLNNLVVML